VDGASESGVPLLNDLGDGKGGMYVPSIPSTLEKLWFLLLFSSASEGCSRSGDGFDLTGSGRDNEDTLMFVGHCISKDLIDPAGLPVTPPLPQSTTVVEGDKMYEGVGEFDFD
jgi:hypothetical protein